MAMSPFYKSIRDRVGTSLLLMPGVAAIIRDETGRILVQQQHDRSWSLPAGAVEPGESPSVAIIREVFEETGLRVRPSRIAGVVGGHSCRVRYAHGDEVEYVVTVFDCEVRGGTVIESNEETRKLAYFRREEMPVLAFEYPNEVFEALAAINTAHSASARPPRHPAPSASSAAGSPTAPPRGRESRVTLPSTSGAPPQCPARTPANRR